MEPLAHAQRQFFAAQGYLIIRQMATPAEVDRIREAAEKHLVDASGPVEYEADVAYSGSPESRDADGGKTIRRLLQAYQRHSSFAEWGTNPILIQPIAQLLDTHSFSTDIQLRQLQDIHDSSSDKVLLVQAHHNCVMTKHPQFSSSTMWHQDFRYWRYQENNLVTAWLALTRETARNGCMRLIPGSHAVKLDQSRFDQESFFRTDLSENRALMHQALRAELEPGDVLLFHSGLMHAAGRNQTEQRKLALVFTYRQTSNLPLPDSRSAEVPDIEIVMNKP